jgi:GNAT superfamily N-acetyltransferase
MKIKIAECDEEILKCYETMAELRPHLGRREFFDQVKRQMSESGYQLVFLEHESVVKAVAGIRVAEWLARGKSLDLEDLVATENDRSKGFGGTLFDWVVDYAREQGCVEVRLVSHVTRYRAHQFYLKKKMIIDAHFFSMPLSEKAA